MIVCIKDLFVLPSDRHENQKLPQYLACKAFFFYFAYDISSFGIRLLELFLVQYFMISFSKVDLLGTSRYLDKQSYKFW